ncbi:DAPF protein, partial [Pseudoatta argentina]
MHGTGNSFVIIDSRSANNLYWNYRQNADQGSCDQVIIITMSNAADCFIHIYNADGSRAEMCGNAARCIGYLIMSEKGTEYVFFVDNISEIPLQNLGPKLENHELFPQKTIVSIAQIEKSGEINLRVWERRTGITASLGSAACAVFVASVFRKCLSNKQASVNLPGGQILIEWSGNVLCVRTAATLESTPPLTAAITFFSPTKFLIFSFCFSINDFIVQSLSQFAIFKKLERSLLPFIVGLTSGWN